MISLMKLFQDEQKTQND